MRNQSLDTAKAFAEGTQLHTSEEVPGAVEAAEVERDHAAEAAHLLFRQFVPGMIRKAGIVDLLNVFPACQILRDSHAVRVVRFHPDGQRFDSAQNEPRIERRENRTSCIL